ncbi:MAG: helix-turn-helix domain-containing protein [Alphaproteobacteria bacterium]|nr:helix-turn-helix domain-containing protein [Alphaproteobacteria bacterium]
MTLLQRLRSPFAEAEPDSSWLPPDARSAGEMLRERREEMVLDLDSVGAALRIKPGYLAALEQGRTNELPGPTYAVGFLRAYADYLGLDVEEILTRFRGESVGLDARPDLSFPLPLAERSLPGGAMLLVALILGLCGYGTWYYLSTGERSRPERVAQVPLALQQAEPVAEPSPGAAPVAAAPAAPAPESPGAQAVSSPPAATAPAPQINLVPGASSAIKPVSAGATAPAPAAAAASAPSPPPAASASGAAASGSGNGGVAAEANRPAATPAAATAPSAAAPAAAAAGAGPRVVIRATADCWIQIRDGDQQVVFSRVLKAGETYKVPPQKSGLSLRTGNAGALEIAVDGKPAPAIGTVGTMRRNVALDPDSLLAGSAVHG